MMTTKPGSKPANRWLDIQIVIATMAMTFSLFLWNIFAGGQSSLATLPLAEPQISLPPDQGDSQGSGSSAKLNVVPTASPVNANPASAQPQSQSFGTIFLGGSAPQSSTVSSGSAGVAPVPVTTTRSSRP